MWSGPRNISTALMRSWENRPDCSVVDEPFYAAYLADTGLDHPCREQILLTQSTDYGKVIEELTRTPVATALQYQKQMTHHIPRGMAMDWCADFKHCFLIRDPAQVIASYVQKMPDVNEDAIGIRRQAELFEQIAGLSGDVPLVIDSNDVLKNPEKVLGELCQRLGIEFYREAMLHWPTGRRDSDGIWASHWYHNVEQSTGFGTYTQGEPELDASQRELAQRMMPCYEQLAAQRILP
ncbi:hypothetical protein DWB85_04140 [Seongchinamella sediminis]|uniref:Sulfotransferase family protein n=2 Tax=Seongchinamella sediminis TaxID=2283635 RepID=A0A3L7E481_9GAMM|nr:hypothetical protein DWB85_04140 [Seongchinamella sediminis]